MVFESARRRRKTLLTERAGAAKISASVFQENVGRGAPAWHEVCSAARPKQPRRLINRQASGFQSRQTCSALWDSKPETISGAGPKTSGNLLDRLLSDRTSHLENPPMIGDEMANTTRPIRASRAGKEHIGQGSTIEYKVQSGKRFCLRIFCASERATSSACRVTSHSDETWLVASAMTCPRNAITAPNGSSPCFTPCRASSRHLSIIRRSWTSASDLLIGAPLGTRDRC
ncbi:hypothetical protein ABIF90_003293 [Bradyrhizobium japonicum]